MSEHDLLLALAELEEAKRLLEWRRKIVLEMMKGLEVEPNQRDTTPPVRGPSPRPPVTM